MKFACLVCEGTGEVPNPSFEQCVKEEDSYRGRCGFCPYFSGCNQGEFIFCDNCQGGGELDLDPQKWKPIIFSLVEEVRIDEYQPKA
jgi:hypothetical protein